MFAVIVNTLAILVGTTLGLLFRKGIPERISSVMMNTLALCVVIIGIQGAVKEKNVLIMILSCVIGVMIGEVLDLDGRINRGTDRIVARFSSGGNSGFTEAMIESTIIMSVGAMMIVGSLNAGLQHDYTMLYTKSLLDFITGIMLGATMGAGVYGSAVFTFLAQGLLLDRGDEFPDHLEVDVRLQERQLDLPHRGVDVRFRQASLAFEPLEDALQLVG